MSCDTEQSKKGGLSKHHRGFGNSSKKKDGHHGGT